QEFRGTFDALLDLVHPEDRGRFAEIVSQAVDCGADRETEFRLARCDGSILWVSARAQVVHDAAGRPARGSGVATDITDRTQAGEALRESQERFARFMQHLPGLAWIKDCHGRYVYANAAAEQAFQKPRAELYGKTDDEVFPPETAARFQQND